MWHNTSGKIKVNIFKTCIFSVAQHQHRNASAQFKICIFSVATYKCEFKITLQTQKIKTSF